MSTPTFNKIKGLLESKNIVFRTVHHPPTPTSEDAARERGEDIAIGGKAIVLKVDDAFHLFVLSAARKLNSKAIRKKFGAKKVRFANKEELWELTELVPGSVPPFGRPILDLDLYVDTSITENDKIAFNAGSLTDSIIFQTEDYLNLAQPEIFLFSKE